LTCTGGEPLQQGEFLLELLEQCRSRGIHTAVETCAYADERVFRRMLHLVDWLFVDIKHVNPQRHLEMTGKSNELILSNAGLASAIMKDMGKDLIVRQLIVPGMTDGQNITDLAELAASLPFVTGVELLAYHIYGIHKYDLLGLKYGLKEIDQPSAEEMEKHKVLLREKGLRVF